MFPVSDDNPQPGAPIVTWALIGVCVAVFLWQMTLTEAEAQRAVLLYGMVPAVVFGGAEIADRAAIPGWATVVTSMFMHGGLAHLGGNMLYLWIFGDNVEHAMGRTRFLAFYLATGAVAALSQGLLAPQSDIPLIGASGAISGVLGAYLLLHPFANVRVVIMPLPFFVRVVSVPAIFALGLWFAIQFLSGLASDVDKGGIAFWAHVGGFVSGMVLVAFFKKRDVPLLQPRPKRVFDAQRPSDDEGPWGRRGP